VVSAPESHEARDSSGFIFIAENGPPPSSLWKLPLSLVARMLGQGQEG